MGKTTYKIYTLGCKVNQYDSFDLAGLVQKKGFKYASADSDIAIVNSCAVTKSAVAKSKRMLNKARLENPRAKLVLTGCWPKAYRDEARKLKLDLVWTAGDLGKLAEKIAGLRIEENKKLLNRAPSEHKKEKARFFLKIQDGCTQFCTYCIVPYVRGKLHSRPKIEVLNEINNAVRQGFREIVLSGIHIGLYGKDNKNIKTKTTHELLELIRSAVKIKGLARLRLSSIEVIELSDELIEFCLHSKKICNHFHIPLQSGSNKILKKMNRPYTREFFRKKVERIKRLDFRAAVSTDVIIGFPGETEKDFKETYNLIKSLKFSKVHIFPFSGHEKTPAFKMPDQIGYELKKDRVRRLKKLCEKIEGEYRDSFAGPTADVVVEKVMLGGPEAGQNKFFGKTEHYLNVVFETNDIIKYYGPKDKNDLIGKMVKIKI